MAKRKPFKAILHGGVISTLDNSDIVTPSGLVCHGQEWWDNLENLSFEQAREFLDTLLTDPQSPGFGVYDWPNTELSKVKDYHRPSYMGTDEIQPARDWLADAKEITIELMGPFGSVTGRRTEKDSKFDFKTKTYKFTE